MRLPALSSSHGLGLTTACDLGLKAYGSTNYDCLLSQNICVTSREQRFIVNPLFYFVYCLMVRLLLLTTSNSSTPLFFSQTGKSVPSGHFHQLTLKIIINTLKYNIKVKSNILFLRCELVISERCICRFMLLLYNITI